MPFLEEIAAGIAVDIAISAARPLLIALLGVQDQQLEKLTTIQQDVRRLLEGPWRQARYLVAEAAETRDDDPHRTVYLNEARQALFLAYGYHPDIHPARAAIAAELAMVIGLLGRREDCHRWAATAHDEAVAVVIETMPRVQRAVNRREWVPLAERARGWKEFNRAAGWQPRRKDFWGAPTKTFASGDEMPYLVTIPHFRSILERVYEEGVPQGPDDLIVRLGLDPSDVTDTRFVSALRSQLNTVPAHQLRGLRERALEVEAYRRTRVTLQPDLELPRYRLRVDLVRPFNARVTWELVA
jgi:hypothetical protein